jgi:translation initiation factor 2D
MSSLVQPYLPSFTKADIEALQIKKTSWKTMKKFIKSLDKEFILKSKDRDNEAIVMDIDFDDATVVDFRPYGLPRKETTSTSSGMGNGPESSSDSDPSVGQKLKIVTLYKAKDSLAPLFKSSNDQTFLTAAELASTVTSYIESENLVPATNKRSVTLNPFLSNTILDGTQPTDQPTIHRGTIPRDALITRIQQHCSPYHLLTRNASAPSTAKPKAGPGPRITLTLATRSGNKTVTRISGLEAFFIAPQPLADELRRTCAGSTSVEKLAGSAARTPVMEVMVQGPQREAVVKALARRGVETRWVDVVDKTKKKK